MDNNAARCLFCLDKLHCSGELLGKQGKKKYQNILDLYKSHFQHRGITHTLKWNWAADSLKPLCENCDRSTEKICRLNQESKQKPIMEEYLEMFTQEVQLRVSINENKPKEELPEGELLTEEEIYEIKYEDEDEMCTEEILGNVSSEREEVELFEDAVSSVEIKDEVDSGSGEEIEEYFAEAHYPPQSTFPYEDQFSDDEIKDEMDSSEIEIDESPGEEEIEVPKEMPHVVPNVNFLYHRDISDKTKFIVVRSIDQIINRQPGNPTYGRYTETKNVLSSEKRKSDTTAAAHSSKIRKISVSVALRDHNYYSKTYREKPITVEVFSCNDCCITFRNYHKLQEHNRIEHSELIVSKHIAKFFGHPCKVCKKVFSTLNFLENHEKTHSKPEAATKKKIKPSNFIIKCEICGEESQNEDELMVHKKQFHNLIPTSRKTLSCEDNGDMEECTNETDEIINSDCGSVKEISNYSYEQEVHRDGKTLRCENSEEVAEDEIDSDIGDYDENYTQIDKYNGNEVENENKEWENRERGHSQNVISKMTFPCEDSDSEEEVTTEGEDYTENSDIEDYEDFHSPISNFKCKLCGKVFINENKLNEHQERDHSQNPTRNIGFPCEECGKVFSTLQFLAKHEEIHLISKLVKCNMCRKEFRSEANLKIHQKRVHSKKGFPCEKCGKILRSNYALNAHDKVVHLKPLKLFKCSTCGKSFNHRSNLPRHEETHKGEEERKRYKCEICEDRYFTQSSTLTLHKSIWHSAYTLGIISCHTCGNKFSGAVQMSRHLAPTPYTITNCPICRHQFRTRCKLLIHYKEKHPGENITHKCPNCSCVCSSASSLQEHEDLGCETSAQKSSFEIPGERVKVRRNSRLAFQSGKYYHCDKCDKKYTTKQMLNIHKEKHYHQHAGEVKPFVCPTCGKGFSSQRNLKIHDSWKHNGYEKRKRRKTKLSGYPCDKCDKKYTHSIMLKIHIQSKHSEGARPFLCVTCGKRFTALNYLRIHENRHLAKEKGEQKVFCEICGKGFTATHSLKCHMRVHTGEKSICSICGQSFTQIANLQRHERTHRGEKPHKCEYCEKAFAQREVLKTHLRTHTGEKPYCCEICDKRFGDRSTLAKHKKIHSKT